MWRDFGRYLQGLRRQWLGLITGPTASFLLLLWQVFKHTDIPTWVFWVVAAAGIPVAGFLAWREEHEKLARKADAKLTGLAAKMVEEYLVLARPHHDSGPH